MSTSKISAPPLIAATLPSVDRLRHALAASEVILPAGSRISRAVRHPAAIIPPYVERTYRFGPPPAFAGADGRYTPYWMYAAQDLPTALWEAGFCTNDVTQPGTFYIPAAAASDGLIATFTLTHELRFYDLNGTVLSKLGISDQIHGEHEWCQWFGLGMFEVLADRADDPALMGFRYPSRRHKSHLALAVQSDSLEQWRSKVDVQVTPFAQMPEFEALRADANYAEPLSGGFSAS